QANILSKQGNADIVLASNSDSQNYLTVGADDNNPISNRGTTLYDLLASDTRFSILVGLIDDDDELKETLADKNAAVGLHLKR
ncbi:11097_t:CDS:1, partial [Paraglomus occultum]